MANGLRGSEVAILTAPAGTEQVEFTEPKKAVEEAGADLFGTMAQVYPGSRRVRTSIK